MPEAGELCLGAPLTLSIPNQPFRIAAADLDRDGFPELVLGHNTNFITVLRNDVGTFATLPAIDAFSTVSALGVADMNDDGHLDIVVATSGVDEARVLLGDGMLNFAPAEAVITNGGPSTDLAIADLNGDETPDVIVGDRSTNAIIVLAGKGDGTLVVEARYPVGQRPRGIQIADLDDNGQPDVIVAIENCYGSFQSPDSYCDPGQVDVLLGKGSATLAAAVSYSTETVYVDRALAGDFDADGAVDVIAVTSDCPLVEGLRACNSPGRVAFLRGTGNGELEAAQAIDAAYANRHGTVTDLNDDGIPDAVIPSDDFTKEGVPPFAVVLLGRPGEAPEVLRIDGVDFSFGVVATDVNGDGALDLVGADYPGSALTFVLADR